MAEDTGIEKLVAFLNRNAYPVVSATTANTHPYDCPRIVIRIPPRLCHRSVEEVEELKALLAPLSDKAGILLQYAPGFDKTIIITSTHLTDATMWPETPEDE